MRRFIGGIRSYQNHSDVRSLEDMPVIWQSGTTLLRDYNPLLTDAPVVLVVPSLINRYEILDLDFGHSFLRSLAAQGFRPLVVDWNAPRESEAQFSLGDYVTQRLMPVLDFIMGLGVRDQGSVKKYRGPDSQPPTPNPRPHLLGYCMGGNLALALAALRPKQVKTLTLMATPWDFHKPDASMGEAFTALADQVEPCMQTTGILPVDIIQSLFTAMQPLQTLTKFTEFAALDPNSMEARQFVLVEDWLNDGVPLTANAARECLREWYGENYTGKMEWHVDGTIIDPRNIGMPCYVVVPGRDRIVPPESSLPLVKLLPHVALHEPMTGHIGLMASRKAAQQVWAPLFHWLSEHR